MQLTSAATVQEGSWNKAEEMPTRIEIPHAMNVSSHEDDMSGRTVHARRDS